MKEIDNKKLIVLTGGAGFIGSCLLRHLNNTGIDNVVVVDELGSCEKWKNLVGKSFVDVLHKDVLFEWLKGKESQIQAFFHLGACSSTVETDASYLLENNYRYSKRLAEYAIANGQRFIYASSAATYGDGQLGFSDDHSLLECYQPLNMYGYSKHLFDLWLLRNNLLDRVVGLKYFNVFGPNEYHKGRMASALIRMVPDALKNGEIRLFKSSDPSQFGDGQQVRDFIYSKDIAKMTAQFLYNDKNGIFNMGSGVQNTWNDLASSVMKAIGRSVEIEYIDMPLDLVGKYQNFTLADMKKSEGLLKPEFTLETAVKDYVQNYLTVEKTW